MTQLRIRFPSVITATAAGLFLLTVTTMTGDAQAQVFFLQGADGAKGDRGDPGQDGADGAKGDKGDPGDGLSCDGTDCTVNGSQNLVVNGVTTTNELAVVDTYDLPDCPESYTITSPSSPVVCTKGADEMVKVGDFWIDRYEMSLWSNADCSGTQYGLTASDLAAAGFPETGNWTSAKYACSIPDEEPARNMTWFQAQQACVLSGKRLCSNAEWQAAAHGTPDPDQTDPGGDSEPCNIWPNSKPSASTWSTTNETTDTGSASGCVSSYGAYDMIGNLNEWADDWHGQGGDVDDGNQGSVFSYDGYFNVDSAEYQGNAVGFPAAAIRGGRFNNGSEAGIFSMSLVSGPSNSNSSIGARCCRSW